MTLSRRQILLMYRWAKNRKNKVGQLYVAHFRKIKEKYEKCTLQALKRDKHWETWVKFNFGHFCQIVQILYQKTPALLFWRMCPAHFNFFFVSIIFVKFQNTAFFFQCVRIYVFWHPWMTHNKTSNISFSKLLTLKFFQLLKNLPIVNISYFLSSY